MVSSRIYDRTAKIYDFVEKPVEKYYFSKWRAASLSSLKGKILEVGVGTGKNLQHYPSGADVTGIDFSREMLKRAQRRSRKNVTLLHMDAENMGFEDESFDHVITTFVLCSVPHPKKALDEIKRVLKPTGTYIALEHMLSSNTIIALHEHLLNPLTRNLFGFNMNRPTVRYIKEAGFEIVEEEHLAFGDVFRRISAEK